MLEKAGWPNPPIAGRTDPELAFGACRRNQEVAEWLRRHGEPGAWVAIDDCWDDPDGVGFPVVHVDPARGLDTHGVRQAWRLLGLERG